LLNVSLTGVDETSSSSSRLSRLMAGTSSPLSLVTYFLALTLCFLRDKDVEVYANEIGDKTPDEVERYYAAFKENWTSLPGTHDTLAVY
jgi:hypothetical protein